MTSYLGTYQLPLPTEVPYGFARLDRTQTRERVSLVAQAWMPGNATGTVFLLHGYSEHCGNFARLIRDLIQSSLAVITFDLRGHGLSGGPPGHTPGPDTYAEDAESVVEAILPNVLPNLPLYLWGHSMGAMVGLQLLVRGALPVTPAAAAFTSPLLGFPTLTGRRKILGGLAPLLAAIAPAMPVRHGMSGGNLSHDAQYLERRLQDPLVRRVTTAGWFRATRRSIADLQEHAGRFNALAPTLLLLAGEERVTCLPEARRFAAAAFAGERHRVVEFPGMRHELEKEPLVRAQVVDQSIAWFRAHRETDHRRIAGG